MSEYLIQGETLTALADEIREISGETGKLGLDTMTTKVSEANDETVAQQDLIAQVASALQGKSVSGGSGAELTTCNVTITVSYDVRNNAYASYTSIENNSIVSKCHKFEAETLTVTINCLCNSCLVVSSSYALTASSAVGFNSVNQISGGYFCQAPSADVANASIVFAVSSNGGSND